MWAKKSKTRTINRWRKEAKRRKMIKTRRGGGGGT